MFAPSQRFPEVIPARSTHPRQSEVLEWHSCCSTPGYEDRGENRVTPQPIEQIRVWESTHWLAHESMMTSPHVEDCSSQKRWQYWYTHLCLYSEGNTLSSVCCCPQTLSLEWREGAAPVEQSTCKFVHNCLQSGVTRVLSFVIPSNGRLSDKPTCN